MFPKTSMRKSTVGPNSSKLKIVLYWGDILYDTKICKPTDVITVGRNPGHTFILDVDPLKLVEVRQDNTADIYFTEKTDGHLRIGKDLVSLRTARDKKKVDCDQTGLYHVHLTKSDKADFVFGHVSMYIDWAGRVEAITRTKEFDKKRLLFLLPMLFLMFLSILILSTVDPPEAEKPPERLITLLPRNAPAKAALGEQKTADGGAQKGDAGKAELSTPEKPSLVATLQKANLGSLVSGLTSLGAIAPENSGKQGVSAPMQQAGTGGFTTEGLKTGAGGKTVGIGRVVGNGQGGFEGTGRLGLSGNSTIEGGTGHGTGDSSVGGGLDRDVIESVIRRRLDRIRLCYERQLNFNPRLSGKISVRFIIGKDGSVLSSKALEDTMKNASVKNCILEEVKDWNFPQPEGGTLVNVDYPFVFESTAKGN